MLITKRNGQKEPLDITKIQAYTSAAVKGLSNVSQSELEVDAQLQFRDGMPSAEIQQTLIKTAVDKIDVDRPNWTFVAARLFLYDLYHRINGFNGYGGLEAYLLRGEETGKIIKGLKDMYDLSYLESHIDESRDMLFNYLGVKTLYDRYLLKDGDGKPIELPQHMFMAIAMFLAQREENRNEWAVKFYDMISKFEVMLATPTLSNARTPRHQLSSCYIGSTPDNIEGIFDGYKEMALLSKFGGGIGWDWTKVRSMGSFIDNHKGAAGGAIPFLKITNDVAIAVDQLGTRKGAIAVYMEPWHMDIYDFLDLKKNSGEERRRAHDLFPALWINDLFMERVEKNETWSLFDPLDVPELTECYGDEFKHYYVDYESNPSIRKVEISAKELWKKILTSYFESGSPFLTFKDTANRNNPNDHSGIIRSSNLCTEIFQNTSPNKYLIRVELEDERIITFEEYDTVVTDEGIKKIAKKLTALDTLDGSRIFMVDKKKIDGETAVCNLASVNLSRIHTKEDIERIVPIAVRALDNVIDLNFYPFGKVKRTNLKSRAIGLGVMGEAQMLAEKQIYWGSQEHFNTIDEIMEMISYNAIDASSNIAIEKGSYPNYDGSMWNSGIFPSYFASDDVKNLTTRQEYVYDWGELSKKVIAQGMRNGHLMAIAPTSSISILTGTTQTIEPVYKRKWFEENLSGLIPVVVPNLSPDTWEYYTPAYEMDQRNLVRAAAIRQKWIDQGQSLNIFITLDKASGKYLNDIYMEAWKLGVKSTYYLRSESPKTEAEEQPVADRTVECHSCQ